MYNLILEINMRIIVTGGLGFIGCHFIELLLSNKNNKNLSILNIDKITYAANMSLIDEFDKFDNYELKRVDIADREKIDNIFNEFEPDSLVHFAAESHVDNSIKSSDEFIKTNIIGTYNLLEATRKYLHLNKKEESFRFLHVSTDEVYGSLSNGDESFIEESSYNPNSPYSASKASSNHLVRAWYQTYGLPCITTNSSNNFGPYQNEEKFIPTIIKKYMRNEKIPLYGNGENIRDWIFVQDNVEAIRKVLDKGEIGQVYNIGGDNELSNIDLINFICQTIRETYPDKDLNLKDYYKFVEDRPGHDFRYSLSSDKLKKEIGWDNKNNFKESIIKTIKWYSEYSK
mgnify:FL=1